MNVGDWVRKWGELLPQKVAIVDDGHEFTYREINERCNRVANYLLDKGVRKGDRVSVLLHNCHEYIEIYLALTKVGAILVPINWRIAPLEIAYILNDCEASYLFFGQDFAEMASYIKENIPQMKGYASLGKEEFPWAENFKKTEDYPSSEPSGFDMPDFEDPHIILYTSGTTGFPKGALLSNRKTFYNSLNAKIFYRLTTEDIFLVNRPLFHSGGLLVNSTPVFYSGATVIYKRRFALDEYLEAIEKYRVTIIEPPATFLNFILKDCDLNRYKLNSLKSGYTGGERVPEKLIRAYHEIGVPLGQLFGMTETSTVCWLPAEDTVRKVGSVGKPVFHGEVQIVHPDMQPISPGETGEVVIRGPILMSGYWNKPDETRKVLKGGWFHSGDLATTDDEGFIYILDREKNVFISGGENVYPAEIDKHLLRHPKIFDAAVYGVPDEKWGEVGKASIILKDNEKMGTQEVVDFLSGKIRKFKIPKHIEFVTELPRTASGKIQKYLLAQEFKEKKSKT